MTNPAVPGSVADVKLPLPSRLFELRDALDQPPEDDPGQVALEGSQRFKPRPALGPLAGDECLGRWMVPGLGEGDHVEQPVELAVAAAVEARGPELAGAGRSWLELAGAGWTGPELAGTGATKPTAPAEEPPLPGTAPAPYWYPQGDSNP